jgi:predicted Zn-dependent peptidase
MRDSLHTHPSPHNTNEMTKPVVHTYANGLRLVYERPTNVSNQTIVRAFVHVGSVNEPDSIRGASHFIEHMCFKGTRSLHTWREVNEPFSHSGAFFNATTTKQHTCFKVNCLDSHTFEFLAIVADMLLNSKFDPQEYKRELNVVREEVKLHQPNSYIENLAFEGTPYEKWTDHLSYHKPGCLPHNPVVEYYKEHYKPQNMVLSVVSSIPFEKIRSCIAKTAFGKMLQSPLVKPILNPPSCHLVQNESRYSVKSTDGATSYIELAVRVGNQFNDPEYHVLKVLEQILGGSMSARLFVELREKRGLTYNSAAHFNLYEPAGVFALCAKTDTARLLKDGSKPGVLPTLILMIDDLIKNGVKESEVRWAKQRIGELAIMNESDLVQKCEHNGERVLLHNDAEIRNYKDLQKMYYKNITKAVVDGLIQKYFAPRVFYLSIIGGKLPRKSEIARVMDKK